ncbi:MAG: PhzF family phenazine biosynthesis protein [Bacteroidales bacterium]|nr:PhzF family phenazine biosynthesis protein [Bacteroidales bacterium]
MKIPVYHIAAFTDHPLGGNPACVVPLQEWMSDEKMLQIARQNAMPETAFFIANRKKIALRWFTPDIEMDLCGHATLATAFVIKTILQAPKDELVFETVEGDLKVTFQDSWVVLHFPTRLPHPASLPDVIRLSLNILPKQVLKARDYVLVYDHESDIKNLVVNRSIFDQINLDPGGVVVTAVGNDCDFVSRFFTPQATILEDPVTGSAHCSLIPYWSEVLHKKSMIARQLSRSQGTLRCVNEDNGVLIGGTAVHIKTEILEM